MKGWVIKIYHDNNEFWGYKSNTKVISDDIRSAYIYLTKEMAEKVASKNIVLDTKIIAVEINEVKED